MGPADGEPARDWRRIALLGARNVLRALGAEDLRLRALALTTITLFALVPALVVAFSFLQAFAGMDALWRRAQDFLIENLAVGARASIEPYLERFVQKAHATGAGIVGGAILVASAVGLFANVERALNELWAVRRRRPLVQKVLTYWAGLTLGPILLAGSLALAHRVHDQIGAGAARSQLLARVTAVLLACLFFAVAYLIVPYTRVRLRAALAGGVVAGIAWELAKGLYTWAVGHVFQYSAIYGSLAAVPIFLLWIYISWTLLLFGARVAFVVQHARQLVRSHAVEPTPLGRELLAARALLAVARAFRKGSPPPDPGEVAAELEVPAEPVRDVFSQLRAAGLVLEAAGGGLLPGRPLEQLTLADVRRVLAGRPPRAEGEGEEALVAALVSRAEGGAAAELSAASLAALCERLDGPGAAPAGPDPAASAS